jgi:hypothetical protein
MVSTPSVCLLLLSVSLHETLCKPFLNRTARILFCFHPHSVMFLQYMKRIGWSIFYVLTSERTHSGNCILVVRFYSGTAEMRNLSDHDITTFFLILKHTGQTYGRKVKIGYICSIIYCFQFSNHILTHF